MTAPRRRGATNRMPDIEKISTMLSDIEAANLTPEFGVSRVSIAPELAAAIDILKNNNFVETEVKHRPAGRKRSVCTP